MANERILVVEDNRDNRDLVTLLLSRAGYIVDTAADGRAGLERAQATLPDMVVLDLGLPVLDGWELASLLKADPRTRSIRILALTGRAMVGDRERALAAGCDSYLAKPLDVDGFTDLVADLLKTPPPA